MRNLLVAELFGSAEQTIASIADDDIDFAEVSKSVVHNLIDLRCIRHVQKVQRQKIAVLFLEVVHCVHLADRAGDAIAACEQLLRHEAAKATVHAGDKPCALRHPIILRSSWLGTATAFGGAYSSSSAQGCSADQSDY